jgi:GMP synthase (glutamine-hydrolysing)
VTRTALVLSHIQFEDAGTFERDLREAGYEVRHLAAWRGDTAGLEEADLVVVMGGPIGAYQTEEFPFLVPEITALERRLAADAPTLGVCLGSQLLAKALGARVFPGHGAEIGWAPVALTPAGGAGPLSEIEGVPVLHWHGDTLDLPQRCELLASTKAYPHQAFARGKRLLALQFHVEVTADIQESWLVGNVATLTGDKIRSLRAEAAEHDAPLRGPASRLLRRWLEGL